MAVLLLAIVVIEGILLLSWWRPYWAWGLPVFSRRIPAPYPALKAFPFHRLEREVAAENGRTWCSARSTNEAMRSARASARISAGATRR